MSAEKFAVYRKRSKVCFPQPCSHLEAYSGFIPVDESSTTYLFFLHIKSENSSSRKPLLLWLPHTLGMSSLFSQFLGNGPLGIDANGKLYRRSNSLLRKFNVIYLDQPAGSGYSFDEQKRYPRTLDQASIQVLRFLRRFLRIFIEYKNRDFYIAGESYGARSAVGVAFSIIATKGGPVPIKLKGVMLGAGFLFPLMDIIDSAHFLHESSLLDEYGKKTLLGWFQMIREAAKRKNYTVAAADLYKAVMNMPPAGWITVFQTLTGFKYHGSTIRSRQPLQVREYFEYANSEDFKRVIHVGSSMVLDSTRRDVAMEIAEHDFFINIERKVKRVFENTRVLFYTAQADAVFPATNLQSSLRNLDWTWRDSLNTARQKPWYKDDNSSLELLGYETKIGKFTYVKLNRAGHEISLDEPEAVHEMYSRFLKTT